MPLLSTRKPHPMRRLKKKSSKPVDPIAQKSRSSSSRNEGEQSRKKRKRIPADSLGWKSINPASFAGVDAGGGMMMLEELEDVDVEWEEDLDGRKVAKFVGVDDEATVTKNGKGKDKGKGKAVALDEEEEDDAAISIDGSEDEEEGHAVENDEEAESLEETEETEEDQQEVDGTSEADDDTLPSFAQFETEDLNDEDEAEDIIDSEPDFDDDLLPDWRDIHLHSDLKRALLSLGFVKPSEIQARALPSGLSGRDVMGIAETGSGKTLAYSLPILSHLLRNTRSPKSNKRRPLAGLILCPTRELALQVVDHLQKVVTAMSKSLESEEEDEVDSKKKNGPPRISIGSVVGGLSAQKQKRIVERGCDILVATPGRLWDLIKADDVLAAGVRGVRFLVIDEADRMIENGHFAELESIVRLTQREAGATAGPDDDDPIFAATSSTLTDVAPRENMQTFVFSATMSKDLQQNLKRKIRSKPGRKSKKVTALEDLVERLDFRDANPDVIDLSPEGGKVASLKESMVECVPSDKDLYLYYFLLRYPGRSLVFVGSIDGIRRLLPLFEVLQVPVYPLHSQLQQKQRLKNLDRFKSSKNGILIATDVAARGLDIPQVDHVIHFNLPRTADAYIHRSGRTARAQNPGFALQLVSPEDKGVQRALMKSLGRNEELPELPIESGFLPKLKERIRVAKAIEKAQHEVKKDNHDRNWLKETAEAMDIDIDPDMLSDGDHDPDLPYSRRGPNGQRTAAAKKRVSNTPSVESLKAELRYLLSEPLMARGVSAKYPTSGSKIIVHDLIGAKGHETLLGAGTAKAWDEVHTTKKRSIINKRKKPSA